MSIRSLDPVPIKVNGLIYPSLENALLGQIADEQLVGDFMRLRPATARKYFQVMGRVKSELTARDIEECAIKVLKASDGKIHLLDILSRWSKYSDEPEAFKRRLSSYINRRNSKLKN